jgi:hypothetical protein
MNFWTRGVDKYTASSSALQSVVKEVTAGAASQTDKAKKLYDYVQKIENTDFALDGQPGMGTGVVPAGRVDQLITEKKGESNQIAYLFLALARAAGLNARPERIASRSHRIFSPQFRQTNQLDTVVIALNLDGKDVTVDPGSPRAPFGTLHWAHSAATGLAMNGGKVDTVLTPPQKGTDNAVLHVGSLNVDQQGAVSGTLKVAYVGQEALRLRQVAVRSGNDTVGDELNRELSAQAPEGFTIKLDHIAYLDEPAKQLLAVVNITGALKQEEGRFAIPRSFFHSRAHNPFPENSERKLAIDVRFPEVVQEKITYVLPSGFGLSGKPEDAKLNWEALGYSSTITPDKNGVTVSRTFARGFTLMEAEKYTPLRDFYDRAAENDQKPVKVGPGVQASNAASR